MATPKIKETELKALLQEMSEDLEKAYDIEKEKLVKAAGEEEPDSAPPSPEASDASASAPPDATDASADASAPPSAPPDASGAPPSAPPGMDGSAPPPGAADPAAAASPDGAPLTPEALQAEYSQLAPEELDMHIKAALSAKEALAASAAPAGMDPSMGAPPAGPSAAPAGPPAPPMAMKNELEKDEIKVDKKAIGGKMVPVKKSESDARDTEIAELKALAKSQAEDIEILTKSVTMVLEQPLRKAVTSVAYVPKVEAEPKSFSPDEAKKIIAAGVHKLNKSERALVLDVFDGRQPATKLEGVLEKLTSK